MRKDQTRNSKVMEFYEDLAIDHIKSHKLGKLPKVIVPPDEMSNYCVTLGYLYFKGEHRIRDFKKAIDFFNHVLSSAFSNNVDSFNSLYAVAIIHLSNDHYSLSARLLKLLIEIHGRLNLDNERNKINWGPLGAADEYRKYITSITNIVQYCHIVLAELLISNSSLELSETDVKHIDSSFYNLNRLHFKIGETKSYFEKITPPQRIEDARNLLEGITKNKIPSDLSSIFKVLAKIYEEGKLIPANKEKAINYYNRALQDSGLAGSKLELKSTNKDHKMEQKSDDKKPSTSQQSTDRKRKGPDNSSSSSELEPPTKKIKLDPHVPTTKSISNNNSSSSNQSSTFSESKVTPNKRVTQIPKSNSAKSDSTKMAESPKAAAKKPTEKMVIEKIQEREFKEEIAAENVVFNASSFFKKPNNNSSNSNNMDFDFESEFKKSGKFTPRTVDTPDKVKHQLSNQAKIDIGNWGEKAAFKLLAERHTKKYSAKPTMTHEGYQLNGTHPKTKQPISIKVEWFNKNGESGQCADFKMIKETQGSIKECYFEVKTTESDKAHRTDFPESECNLMRKIGSLPSQTSKGITKKYSYTIFRVIKAGSQDARIEVIKNPYQQIINGTLELNGLSLNI